MGYTRKQPKNFSITPLRPKVKKKNFNPANHKFGTPEKNTINTP